MASATERLFSCSNSLPSNRCGLIMSFSLYFAVTCTSSTSNCLIIESSFALAIESALCPKTTLAFVCVCPQTKAHPSVQAHSIVANLFLICLVSSPRERRVFPLSNSFSQKTVVSTDTSLWQVCWLRAQLSKPSHLRMQTVTGEQKCEVSCSIRPREKRNNGSIFFYFLPFFLPLAE